VSEYGSWMPFSLVQELQLKGARTGAIGHGSQGDATLLEAATKQRSEDHDREQRSLYDSDF
jgi:hypothetical protein